MDLMERKQPLNSNDSVNSFMASIGVLSALSYPVFYFVWDMKPIGPGKYIVLLAIFGSSFLALTFGFDHIAIFRRFSVSYINWVMPAFCIAASFTVAGVFSAPAYAAILIAIHAMFLLVNFLGQKLSLNIKSFGQVNRSVLYFLPLGYGFILWIWIVKTYELFQADFLSAWTTVPAIVLLVFFCLWFIDHWYKKINPGYKWAIYLLTGLLLTGLVYRPELFIDRWHYNYFMAPINDVIHGRVLFVNTTSQYGVGVIYALAFAFSVLHFPIGYEGLSIIVAALFIMQYLLLALMLWKTSDDLIIGIGGMLVMVYFNYLTVFWPSMLRTPAQSPLRYGLSYLLMAMALLNVKRSSRHLQVLEFILLGIASVWSLETFLYALLSLDAFYFVNDVLFASQFQAGLKIFGKRLVFQAGIIAISWGLLLTFTHIVSGQFPSVRMYLDYFQSYTAIPYDGGSIALHIFRTGAVMFVYLFSIFTVLFDRLRQKNFLSATMSSMLIGMSVVGILQYVYYFIFYIDYHLALLCVPLTFVLALWIAVVRRNSSMSFPLRASVFAAFFISLIVSMIVTAPSFYGKFSKSLLYESLQGLIKNQSVVIKNPYRAFPSNKSVENLVHLIENYAVSQQQIAIFAAPNDQVEALFLAGKTDLLGMSEPGMSAISPVYSEYVLRQAKAMSGQPTYIFYDTAKDALTPLQREAYLMLIGTTDYKIIDKRRNIVVLKRTTP